MQQRDKINKKIIINNLIGLDAPTEIISYLQGLDNNVFTIDLSGMNAQHLSTIDIAELSFDDRIMVAKNPNTPIECLIQLADSNNRYIVEAVAENPNTPIKILNSLANSYYDNVRAAVAKNSKSSAEILAKLSVDQSSSVRRQVARNENTSIEILRTLSKDISSDVKDEAIINIWRIEKDHKIKESLFNRMNYFYKLAVYK